ncbi:MAG TPA: hypothetical protein ENN22_14300 [bacterium]|nr:hypothetical protein [bacterium]
MGQQQLLLIVLAVIIVGIAIIVGINMFSASAAAANQDAVVNDCLDLAGRAYQWAIKPEATGGGNNSFKGIDFTKLGLSVAENSNPRKNVNKLSVVFLAPEEYVNENGSYTLDGSAGTYCTITGTGVTADKNGTVCEVTTKVNIAGNLKTAVARSKKLK